MRTSFIFSIVLLSSILQSCWPTSIAFNDSGSMDPCLRKFQMDPLEISAPNAPVNYNINLTEAVKNGIQNNTKLMLASGDSPAQVVITGKITGYSVSAAAIAQGDQSAKNRLTVSAQMNILLTCPEKELEQEMKVNSTRFVDFDASKDISTVEPELLEQINQQIIQDVINQLYSNW